MVRNYFIVFNWILFTVYIVHCSQHSQFSTLMFNWSLILMVQIITYELGGLAALLTRPQSSRPTPEKARPRPRPRLNITATPSHYCDEKTDLIHLWCTSKLSRAERAKSTLNVSSVPAHHDVVISDLHWNVAHVMNTVRTRIHRTPGNAVRSYTTISSIGNAEEYICDTDYGHTLVSMKSNFSSLLSRTSEPVSKGGGTGRYAI